MKRESLNISGKLDSASVNVYRAVSEAAKWQSVDYLVVGASARDLVLHYGYGFNVQRATGDLDFAFAVKEWAEFLSLRHTLIATGFNATKLPMRLTSPDGIYVDLVPFGELADEAGNIAWPPDHDHVMSVLGFAEAHAHAETILIQDEPPLAITVVSPLGFVLLKLIAWRDRRRELRAKDALDIRYILENCARLLEEERLWGTTELLETYEHDIDLVAAHLLGSDTREIASTASIKFVDTALREGWEDILADMDHRFAASTSQTARLLSAFSAGFSYHDRHLAELR
jgi:predicted nucleotidyltransferase